MKYLQYERLHHDAKDIPDGEIFTVYTEGASSPFLITEEKPALWAFCMKMKGEYTLSAFKKQNVGEKEVKLSMQQILYAKRNGWSATGQRRIDDSGEYRHVLRCLFCQLEATEINGPCICRGIKPKEKKGLIDLSKW